MHEIYYVSYGSNMLTKRFETYIKGGYTKGNIKNHLGCRNKSLPKNKVCLKIRGQLVMSGSSKNWDGGGYAFYNSSSNKDIILAAGYLITFQQFEDVLAQENNFKPGDLSLRLEEIIKNKSITINAAQYDKVIFLGYYDGTPMLTLTSKDAPNLIRTRPSDMYLEVMKKGIKETFQDNIPDSEIVSYINKFKH